MSAATPTISRDAADISLGVAVFQASAGSNNVSQGSGTSGDEGNFLQGPRVLTAGASNDAVFPPR